MRKMLVAVIILTLIVACSIWEQQMINKICIEMNNDLEKVKTLAKNKDAKTNEKIEKLDNQWEKTEPLLDVLTPHDETDEINIKLARIKSYAQFENTQLLISTIEEIEQQFEEIRRKSEINVANIF